MTVIVAGFILSFLISTAYGAGFHFFVGGPLRTILSYLLAAWIGFACGHLIGEFFNITRFQLGAIHLLPASIGSWVLLLGARWLIEPPSDQ